MRLRNCFRRLVSRQVLTLFAALIGAVAHVSGQTQTVHINVSGPGAPGETNMPMPLLIPLFLSDDHFSSSLVMINPVETKTYADISLRDTNGVELARKRVNFGPHSQHRINVAEILAGSGVGQARGSIVINQNPKLKSQPIAAALSLTFTTMQRDLYLDEESEMPSGTVLRAVSGSTTGAPLLAVASLSQSDQQITVTCTPAGEAPSSVTLTLSPGHTIIREGCTKQISGAADAADSDSFVAPSTSDPRPIGIEISSTAPPGEFGAFGIAHNVTAQSTLLSAIAFDDPMMMHSSTTIYVGVPTGATSLLSNGYYTPQLSLEPVR